MGQNVIQKRYNGTGLFLPLRGQEAYASNSLFPYLATFWEPRRHDLIAMDLSGRSLRRARLRCLPRLRALKWLRADLGDEDVPIPEGLAHFDCYGVLHHMARSAAAVGRIARLLAPGGTARIMVYSSDARAWIRRLPRVFALLGLNGAEARDRAAAPSLLKTLAQLSPALRAHLAPMDDALSHPARFVDTFFHAREARLGLAYWLRAIADAGLTPIGLYDRYGELDDLPNPLLEVPGEAALRDRIADRRFENNLELFLTRTDSADEAIGKPGPAHRAKNTDGPSETHLPSALALRSPPRSWWDYRETRKLPWDRRRTVWRHFLANLCGRPANADARPVACPRARSSVWADWARFGRMNARARS